MITKITMDGVASYKNPTILETDKKVNLIYGLNGTGKSTLSDMLYDRTNLCYLNCSIEGLSDEEILVYNQRFIRDYFYEAENLPGIFTLSRENKQAEEMIRNAEKEIKKQEDDKKVKTDNMRKCNEALFQAKQKAANKIWEIKTKYAGGDRVLEFCLTGLMSSKDILFNYLLNVAKPAEQPLYSADVLKKEVEAIQGNNAQKYELIPTIKLANKQVENNELFRKVIIGNENSTISDLIIKMKNSDWVKQGLEYLPEQIDEQGASCPFCQERTITEALVANIQGYFDETYENNINELKNLLSIYEEDVKSIPSKEKYEVNPFVTERKAEFSNLYNALLQCLSGNASLIIEKLKNPSKEQTLTDSTNAIYEFNQFVTTINNKIEVHNKKIDNKAASLNEIQKHFWDVMRWSYDQTILAYSSDKSTIGKNIKTFNDEIRDINGVITAQKQIITDQQKNTVNIEDAILNINNGLLELGIDGFGIEKHSETLYKIARTEKCTNTFHTLSEGEKMIISFLYFRELCKGKKNASSTSTKKIIVIDDPISSLSHIYIFNISLLIKNDFLNSPEIEQVFLLTHSLYFFYEMTDPNHERRKLNQKLFRIIKNSSGSQVSEMKYEEIQNDYHSYWSIVKDDKQPPALIANCMRNIIEYFFHFIEKKDLNNVFQKQELKATKYQAFCRYINRESHSLGQNIYDLKEFDYNDFKEAFSLVFTESGYKEHFDEMMK